MSAVVQFGSTAPHLARSMGRWALVGLMLSIVVGSSIFWQAGVVAGLVGRMSPWAYVAAALGVGFIVVCTAEVASAFDAAGGPYLYAREAYGSFAGILVGWLLVLARIAATASFCGVLTAYLGTLWPAADHGAARVLLITLLIATSCAVNIRGVRESALVVSVATVAKLTPILLFIFASGILLLIHQTPLAAQPPVTAGFAEWAGAMMLTVYAYSGFESALIPMSESSSPKRDAPFALLVTMSIAVFIYTGVQILVVLTLPDAASSKFAVIDAADHLLGHSWAVLLGAVPLLAAAGYIPASILAGARLPYALAVRREFPALFAKVHPRYRTPLVSIALFSLATWVMAVAGTFIWAATLSVVARLACYAAVCGCVLVFRHRGVPATRIRGAPFCALAGMAFCGLLAMRVDAIGLYAVMGVASLALVTWFIARKTTTP